MPIKDFAIKSLYKVLLHTHAQLILNETKIANEPTRIFESRHYHVSLLNLLTTTQHDIYDASRMNSFNILGNMTASVTY